MSTLTNFPQLTYYMIPEKYEIDIDELEGIIHQLEAIAMGWADDFKVITKYEDDPENFYQWEKL